MATATKTARTSKPAKRVQPPLAIKKQPEQQRATETYERILAVTAQTLADVGIERLSTNLVCERAGLTPPALYRYFPNKYALLSELGERLMERQNELIPRWVTLEVLRGSTQDLERALCGLVLDTFGVTEQTVGGVWILRALRAVPALQELRLNSHSRVTREQTVVMTAAFPDVDVEQLRLAGRIAVDLIYATVELLCDEPLSTQTVAEIVAGMIASHLTRLRPDVRAVSRSRRGAAHGVR
ncbi:TetR family transcriptional regulator [Paraburkholderia madseniana]|uniref:TetR family transcriptional regulator n=1 Tax=Paraburkholderia madseniana TaxID=2599607 RepID=A0A6N6W136_9BURK|nr:TetR/AcrR family transcriptional regulator [Paraburkholderia madseniana]KAE8753829.1 TetR family transcriptional regulator [Paraburkholderia madseniana]